MGRCECGGVRGCAAGEIVFGCGIRVRDAKSRGLGGVWGVGAKGSRRYCGVRDWVLRKVFAVGWGVRIWGRGVAAVCAREAAGVGLGYVGVCLQGSVRIWRVVWCNVMCA